MITLKSSTRDSHRRLAFTIVEVVMCLAIIVLVLGGILVCFSMTTQRAEWSGYSLAAQSLAIQQLEQARAAKWDNTTSVNELTNLNLLGWTYNAATQVGTGYCTNILDIPYSASNYVVATNFVTIKMVTINNATNPAVQMQMVMVQTVWPFCSSFGGTWTVRYFTNTTATYCSPDDRDFSTL